VWVALFFPVMRTRRRRKTRRRRLACIGTSVQPHKWLQHPVNTD